ncbi:hypothetical protein FB451DRAFT_1567919 [Mycena latifolia]|nr:hypothetical protein FB451DRAFT_1567919 [Mycena latifolia]
MSSIGGASIHDILKATAERRRQGRKSKEEPVREEAPHRPPKTEEWVDYADGLLYALPFSLLSAKLRSAVLSLRPPAHAAHNPRHLYCTFLPRTEHSALELMPVARWTLSASSRSYGGTVDLNISEKPGYVTELFHWTAAAFREGYGGHNINLQTASQLQKMDSAGEADVPFHDELPPKKLSATSRFTDAFFPNAQHFTFTGGTFKSINNIQQDAPAEPPAILDAVQYQLKLCGPTDDLPPGYLFYVLA